MGYVERNITIKEKPGLCTNELVKMAITAQDYESKIYIKIKGKVADAKSIILMSVMTSLARCGEEMTICAEGMDAQFAVKALWALVESNFDENKARYIMEKTQFTMLGMTGSGKTCYLLGMYKKMLGGIKGFTITTDDDTDVDLRRKYNSMSDASLGIERFPQKTNQTDTIHFTLNYAYSAIMPFDWIDYPGGFLSEKNSINAKEYESLKSYIKHSGALFICVDGGLLKGDLENDEKIELIKDNCSSLINPFLGEYLNENKYLPPTAIIVTKWDLCKNYVSYDDLDEIIAESFSPLFVEGNDSNRFVTVLPVSLGENISEDDNHGRLSPQNLQMPIYMGIWFSLIEEKTKCEAIANVRRDEINNVNEKLKQEKDAFFSWLNGDKIKNLERQLADKAREFDQEKIRLEKAIHDAGLLQEKLQEKVKLSWFNGERYDSFIKAAESYLVERYFNE